MRRKFRNSCELRFQFGETIATSKVFFFLYVNRVIFFIQDNIELFQGDIVMTSQIRNNLRNRGILVPNNDPRSPLSRCGGKKPLKRPKRAIMSTNRGSDLRWPIGESGKREVPYEITGLNSKLVVKVSGLLERWNGVDIHVQYCDIMRFTVLHNRHHKVSQSAPFFTHCKTVTITLQNMVIYLRPKKF